MGTSRSEPSLPPPEFGKTGVNGHHLYWELHGPGDALCVTLLHHRLGSLRDQIADFTWQVHTFDRWGYGQSDEHGEFSGEFLWTDMQETNVLLEALEVDRTATAMDDRSRSRSRPHEIPEQVNQRVLGLILYNSANPCLLKS